MYESSPKENIPHNKRKLYISILILIIIAFIAVYVVSQSGRNRLEKDRKDIMQNIMNKPAPTEEDRQKVMENLNANITAEQDQSANDQRKEDFIKSFNQ